MSLTTPGSDEAYSDTYRILDEDGAVLPDADPPDISEDRFLELYEHLVFARRFDQRALRLQRAGRIATYAPMTGQEGAQVASAAALSDQDWLFPTYRDHAARMVHGVDPEQVMLGLAGIAEGQAPPTGVNVAPECIPIATQLPQAVGAAWAADYRGEDRVVLSYLGDGATSEGDFHEALNFAGVFDTPTVFFCNNNQWAISVPLERQTGSDTIAKKAAAYGFEGIRVDGMDPLAVYAVTRRAVESARGDGTESASPILIEAVQYRLGAHTTADDPSVYRDEEEVEYWRERDPLDRLAAFLRHSGRLDDDREDAIRARVNQRVDEAIEAAEAATDDPDRLFENVYETPTPNLRAQRERLTRLRERHGEGTVVDDRS